MSKKNYTNLLSRQDVDEKINSHISQLNIIQQPAAGQLILS